MSNNTPMTPTNPNRRKLTKQEELYVYHAVTTGEARQEELAVRFNVHFNTIVNVVRRQRERLEALNQPEPLT